jgi:Helicase HerA, central domain
VISEQQREALGSLRLSWAPTTDDLWRPQGALHVGGLHEDAIGMVMAAFDDAVRDPDASPLGVVVQGPAGSGKTHLLGQVRERVQGAGGFFFLIELLDATRFWQSCLAGILDSLGRPGADRESQLKDLLWQLASIAHISRAARRAIAGEDELSPETLENFVVALDKVRRERVWQRRHALRALVLLGAADLGLQDVGEAFLHGTADPGGDERAMWGLRASTGTPQETVRDISRLVALAGPAVLAVDQIDTLLAQSADRTEDPRAGNRDMEHVAHGLMSIRQTMRRTVPVVACLPSAWASLRERATDTVQDRFRATSSLEGLPTPEIGKAILERRFTASYRDIGFAPPYPSWPIKPSAFRDAPQYTPRQLLKRADAHVRGCLQRGDVEELDRLSGLGAGSTHNGGPGAGAGAGGRRVGAQPGELDRLFAEYAQRAVIAPALDPESEDTTMPALLSAALDAWIAERGETQQPFRVDPPPGARAPLHGRLRQSIDAFSDDERHWAFRAIASSNAIAALTRIRKAGSAAGFGPGAEKRKLFLLRNTAWPRGKKTAAVIAEFENAGGRTLAVPSGDLRTMIALRDLIHEDHADLLDWLAARRPAHGLTFLREALGREAGEPPAPILVPEPIPVPEPVSAPSGNGHLADSPTVIPLGVDSRTAKLVTVDLAALRKHTAIFAGSGSGKTVLIRRLVEECAARGVSSIVLDPNNDLSRLGSPWSDPPPGWDPADDARAAAYLANTEVVIWTPRRAGGRPLAFAPLPDFAIVVGDPDEFSDAVDSAVAALEPRALITGNTAKANRARAVLKEALQEYGRRPDTTLRGFIDMLADLPADVSSLSGARNIAAELSQNLRAAMINDSMFGGAGTAVDPAVLLNPSNGYRARVSVISMIGLPSDAARQGFVNQLQMALFAWIKRNPAGDRPLGGLLVMDEAQTLAPSDGKTPSTSSTLALSAQARKYGLGLVFATQAPKGLHNRIVGNAATQFFGLLNSPAQIGTVVEIARVKGGRVPDISRLRAGQFYVASEGQSFHKIQAPWCLSFHPPSPPAAEEVLALAQQGPVSG